MRCKVLPFVGLWLSLASLSGCGGGGSGTQPSGEAGDDQLTIKTYEAKSLLPAEFETPELDGGRIKVPTPKGWKRGDRQNNVLIRFYTDDATGVPRVLMAVEPSKYTGADSLTLENVSNVNEQMQAELDEKAKEKNVATFRESCLPLVLGNNVWVRHVVGKKWKGHGIVCVTLRSIFDKRVYKLELEMMDGERKFKEYQKALYAIAGRLEFIDKSAAPKTENPSADAAAVPSAEKPATK